MHSAHQWVVRSLLIIAIAVFVLPSPVRAQDVQTDARCWPQAQCATAGGTFDATIGGCSAPWGYCYVQKPIPIAINIPGAQGKQVSDLREYIVLLYRYGIVVAAILAVVVIMIGGVMWLTSGGADRLKTAQQWIGNAIVGLLLVLGSYVLLQTINPDLVRLSLPRTIMLRPVTLGSRFCSLVDANTFVRNADGSFVDPAKYAELPCGNTYATTGAAQKTCFGEFCASGSICIPTSTTTFRCETGVIGGEVVGDGDAFLDNNIELHVVCADGSTHELATMDGTQLEEKKRHKYAFPKGSATVQEVERACGGETLNGTAATSTVRGFFLKLDVNDGDLFGPAYARSGDSEDDWFAVGPESCGGSSQPLQTPRSQAVNASVEYETDPSRIAWLYLSKDKLFPQLKIYNAIRDVNSVPFVCNIGLSRGAFPARR